MITASQTLKIFELLNKHFKNEEDAKTLVYNIKQVVDRKFQGEKERLATKEDIRMLENKMEIGFKDMLKWTVILLPGFSSFIIGVIKLI